jgi:IS5 family transposase
MKVLATTMFVLVDDLCNTVIPKEIQSRLHKEKAKLSDSEIITISILGEMTSNDSEKAWLSFVAKNMRDLFPNICERSRFNRVKRNLVRVIEHMRMSLNQYLSSCSDYLRIVDSAPLQVCEFGRARYCRLFSCHGASYGVCPSKKQTYYGYKIHALCTDNGIISDFIITAANVDDKAAVWELVEQYNRHLLLIGDKGYISSRLADDLLNEKGIKLLYMKRDNAKEPYPKPLRQAIFKIRRRVETSFSQLADQFNIETTRAKSLCGLNVRLQIKVLAFNMGFLINQLLGRSYNDLAKIKSLVF